jgi:hypothetical protein
MRTVLLVADVLALLGVLLFVLGYARQTPVMIAGGILIGGPSLLLGVIARLFFKPAGDR